MTVSVDELVLHPRVSQQGLDATSFRPLTLEALAQLQPFEKPLDSGAVVLVDWDHRLPSRGLSMRLHLFRSSDARERFLVALAERQLEVATRDKYPEFDVPDFDDLPSDETYDVELTREEPAGSYRIESVRLVSPWRRQLAPQIAERAAAVVRASAELADAKSRHPNRPPGLGEVEAVALIPPCESKLPRWSVDVWWLTAFDGRMGKGWSFLVGLEEPHTVLGAREMSIRAS